jgi:hypothetical protein
LIGSNSSKSDYGGVKASYWDKDEHIRKWVNEAGPAVIADAIIVAKVKRLARQILSTIQIARVSTLTASPIFRKIFP